MGDRKNEALLYLAFRVLENSEESDVYSALRHWIREEIVDAARELVGTDVVVDLAPEEPKGGNEIYLLRLTNPADTDYIGELVLTHNNAETLLRDILDACNEDDTVRQKYNEYSVTKRPRHPRSQ
jgi:hypothetical protein